MASTSLRLSKSVAHDPLPKSRFLPSDKVGGLVENPVALSLGEIEKLGYVEQITMHHCVQGWTGIAKWGGIPMKALVELVRPKPVLPLSNW